MTSLSTLRGVHSNVHAALSQPLITWAVFEGLRKAGLSRIDAAINIATTGGYIERDTKLSTYLGKEPDIVANLFPSSSFSIADATVKTSLGLRVIDKIFLQELALTEKTDISAPGTKSIFWISDGLYQVVRGSFGQFFLIKTSID